MNEEQPIEPSLITIVAVVISAGVGLYARMARNRSFVLWLLVSLVVLVGGEWIISTAVRLLLAGLTDTTLLTIVVYVCFGGVMLLSAFIMPSAEQDTDE